jgi:hypothetical protein
MGIVRRGLPANIIAELQTTYQIPNFVESGTFLGDTAYWASKIFERAFTIEFSEPIYRRATEKYGYVKNISFLYGHTRERLKEVVTQLSAPAIFWLDAHWSGGQTYGESDECPVLDENVIIAVPSFARSQMIRYCQEVNTAMWNATVGQTDKSRLRTRAERIYRGVVMRLRKMQKHG